MDMFVLGGIIAGAFAAGILLAVVIIYFYNRIFLRGVQFGETRLRRMLGLPDAEEKPAPAELPEMHGVIKSPSSLIVDRYELVFDLELVGFLAMGEVATKWPRILTQIRDLVDQHYTTFPEKTNTVVVRAVRFLPDGTGEYVFEGIHNAELTMDGE